jgi:hypothetical protein
MKKRLFVLVAATVAFGTVGVQAQVIVGTTPSFLGNCLPFGCHAVSRYQQIYSASYLSTLMGSMTIGHVGFFYQNFFAQSVSTPLQVATYEVRLVTTSVTLEDFSADLDANIADESGDPVTPQLFGLGSVGDNVELEFGDQFGFDATNPFFYNPATDGNLLLDILVSDATPLVNNYHPARTVYFDSEDENDWTDFGYPGTQAEHFARAFEIVAESNTDGDPNLLGYQVGTHSDEWGLVTMFGPATTQTVIPEPMTIGLVATGLVGIAGAALRRRRGISEDA